MKVSFITTVYNEELTINLLLKSLFSQSKFPDEIIVVDGGSTDATASVISNLKSQISNKQIKLKIITKKGNRSVGRNEAIENASNEIIACSDAGCTLDKDWVKNITKPFENLNVDVVAGYYRGVVKTTLEKNIIPYFLVMDDKIDSDNFLPATRSMAFRKSIWKKVNGFNEEYSHNEDYAFATQLKKIKAKVVFSKNAIVYWLPKRSLREAWTAFYRFALGDAQARIFRPKVAIIFFRYILGISILIIFFITKLYFFLGLLLFAIAVYIAWSISKNYKYVKHFSAIYYLPILQVTSDIAIIIGTIVGIIN